MLISKEFAMLLCSDMQRITTKKPLAIEAWAAMKEIRLKIEPCWGDNDRLKARFDLYNEDAENGIYYLDVSSILLKTRQADQIDPDEIGAALEMAYLALQLEEKLKGRPRNVALEIATELFPHIELTGLYWDEPTGVTNSLLKALVVQTSAPFEVPCGEMSVYSCYHFYHYLRGLDEEYNKYKPQPAFADDL